MTGTPQILDDLRSFPSRDFWVELARSKFSNASGVVIRGHKTDVDSADGFEDIWEESGDLSYLTTAEQQNIVSTSDEDGAGSSTGLLTMLIQGVDNDHVAIQEVVALNGTTNVLTSLSYLRVNNMVGLTGNSNLGTITATASTAGTVQDHIDIGDSISHSSHYTVPAGHTAMVVLVEFNGTKAGGGQQPQLELQGQGRLGGASAPWIMLFDTHFDTAISNNYNVEVPVMFSMTEKTDIRLRVDTDQDNTSVRSRMSLLLIAD